ncbi:MAG TPA: OB-fold nucleic acid binding domain-containing protein [Actinomycetota bacterium]
MGALRRFLDRLTESDEARLSAEIHEWAESVPGTTRIADISMREKAKVAGVIRRMTVFPMKDNESLEAVVADGSGEIVVRFMGRRAIGGLGLGTKVVVEGLVAVHHGEVQMMNPRLEFTA